MSISSELFFIAEKLNVNLHVSKEHMNKKKEYKRNNPLID